MRSLMIRLSLALALTACGGGKSKPAEEPGSDKPMEADITDEEVEEYLEESKVKLDQEAAKIALDRGARKVKQCRETAEVPPGEGDVEVVFDGTKGRVTDVILGPEWMTLPDRAQTCIKKSYVGEIVPPFDGEEKLTTTVKVLSKAEEEAAKKKDEEKKQ